MDELTVLILTYEQPKEKVLLTIASAIQQREVELQVIISDDGSSNPCLQEFMEEKGFKDYKIIHHAQNEGTVINFSDALDVSDGDYIKSFGAGDCFSMGNIKVYYEMLVEMRKGGYKKYLGGEVQKI